MPDKSPLRLAISIITRTVVCAVLLIIGVMLFGLLRMQAEAPPARPPGAQAQTVMVMEARPVSVQRTWTGFGTARAMDSADVPARVTATVVAVPAEILEGAQIEQGALLAQLDETDFVRQVEIAEQTIADLNSQLARLEFEAQSWQDRLELAAQGEELARAELQRVEQAFTRDVATQREVDLARQSLISAERERVMASEEVRKLPSRRNAIEAQLTAQRATLRIAQEDVQRTRVRSPLAGTLEDVDVEIGENVTSGDRIARVVDLSRIEVPLQLPAQARRYIRRGDVVRLQAIGTGTHLWHGTVARLSPTDDEATRTLAAYIELTQDPAANDEPLLPPGRYLLGEVLGGQSEPRWVVPRRALRDGRVLVAEEGTLRAVPVQPMFHLHASFPELGVDDSEWVALSDSLPAGALVVVDASPTLVPGRMVTPVRAAEGAAAALDGAVSDDARSQPPAAQEAGAVQ